mgnify:CR=1 FL=1
MRVRPLGDPSVEASDTLVSDKSVAIRTVKSTAQGRDSVEENCFSFDSVFDSTATQAQVFESAMLPQVKSLFAGRDTLTFAYGITNAGKTYTIQGRGVDEHMGVLPRALEAMFAAIHTHREIAAGRAATAPPLSAAAAALELDPACT